MASFPHLIDQRRLIGPGGSTVSGEIFFYYTGTSVLAPIWLDSSLTVPSTNPVVVSAGQIIPSIFLDADVTYRRVIVYSDGTQDQEDPLGNLFSEGEVSIPVGAILDYAGTTPPSGFQFCYGQELSRTDFSDLYNAIGTTYGAGNGTTTFNLPDYRGRAGVGKDNMGGTAANRFNTAVNGLILGSAGGEQVHVLTEAELANHTHTLTDPGHAHGYTNVQGSGGIAGGSGLGQVNIPTGTATTGIIIASSGGSIGHNNIQPSIVINKIIKTAATTFLSLLGIDLDFTGKANATALGVTPGANNMGTFTGTIIPDNVSAKAGIQSLETSLESVIAGSAAKANASALGVTASATDMGTFTGTIIPDNVSAKAGIQSLESTLDVVRAGGNRKVVYASDWNVFPNGSDQLANINTMITMSGASHFIFPSVIGGSTYVVSGTINLPDNITIEGQNYSGTTISCSANGVPIFSIVNRQRVFIKNIRLIYSAPTPTSGADAIYIRNSFFCTFRDIWTENTYNGIRFSDVVGTNSGNHSVIGFWSFAYILSGIRIENVIDINISHFRLSAQDSIRGTDAGIALVGGCEAITVSQGDITLGFGHGVSTAGIASSTARGQSPWYNKFNQVFFDSPKGEAAYLRQATHLTFTDCWFASSGHDEAVGYGSALNIAGVSMSQCLFTKFIGGECYGNGGVGFQIFNDNQYTSIIGVSLRRNMFSRASNGPGVQILAGTSQFLVRDCLFIRDPDTTTYRMSVAVEVGSGASDQYNIADNLLGGTTISDAGTGVNKRVANNY